MKRKEELFLLRQLQLFGLDHLDYVMLAALSDERPLLLIGLHGTAKSEMLNRFAHELELNHRHYNASLLSLDDLLGYPILMPEKKQLEFVETEASVWGAESIFLDEISRCRPEVSNKLFSLIHESRIQGIKLSQLRYRWSAMNPPLSEDGLEEDEPIYSGSFPLDPALADRFCWVVPVPTIDEMSIKSRKALINKGGSFEYKSPQLSQLTAKTREQFGQISTSDIAWAVEWSTALAEALRDASFHFSGRRHIFLRDSVLWIYAAAQVLNRPLSLEDAALEALHFGIPQRAQGVRIESAKVRSIHRKACEIAGTPHDSLLRVIQAETDPVQRIFLSFSLPDENADFTRLSEIVVDAFSNLRKEERMLLSILLSRHSCISNLATTTIETLTAPLAEVVCFASNGKRNVNKSRTDAQFWNEVTTVISRLKRDNDPDYEMVANALMTLFSVKNSKFDPHRLVEKFRGWRTLFTESQSDLLEEVQ